MTLTFNPLRATVMTYSHAKVQGQQSIGSEDRVETNGRTDAYGGDRITSLANAVSTKKRCGLLLDFFDLLFGLNPVVASAEHRCAVVGLRDEVTVRVT